MADLIIPLVIIGGLATVVTWNCMQVSGRESRKEEMAQISKTEAGADNPWCATCAICKYDNLGCACWRLDYAWNELLKEIPLLNIFATEDMRCPDWLVILAERPSVLMLEDAAAMARRKGK